MTRQLQLLAHLASTHGPTFPQVTAALGVNRGLASNIVGLAIKAGLVARAGDWGASTYHLTPAGARRHQHPPAPSRQTPKEH